MWVLQGQQQGQCCHCSNILQQQQIFRVLGDGTFRHFSITHKQSLTLLRQKECMTLLPSQTHSDNSPNFEKDISPNKSSPQGCQRLSVYTVNRPMVAKRIVSIKYGQSPVQFQRRECHTLSTRTCVLFVIVWLSHCLVSIGLQINCSEQVWRVGCTLVYRPRPTDKFGRGNIIVQRLNQSIKIYIAPLQDTYSEALPTQAKRKRTVFRRWWN